MDLGNTLKIIVPYGNVISKVSPKDQEFYKRVYMLFVRFCDLLSKGLDLPYDLISSDARSGGGFLLPNGTWTGSIGMIQRGEADMVVMNMIITEERWKVVDFTYPHHADSITFVTRKLRNPPGIAAILRPFSFQIWVALLISIIVMTGVLMLFLRKKETYSDILFGVFAVFVHQSVSFKRKSWREKLLMFTWILGGMLITFCYLSLLLSVLTFPTVKIVRDIAELAKQVKSGKYKVMLRKSSPFLKMLLKSTDKSTRFIAEAIDKNPNGLGSLEMYLNMSNSELAFVEKETALYFANNDFFKSQDYFFFVMESIVVRKGFPLKMNLDALIHIITAAGLYTKILEDFLFKVTLSLPINYFESDGAKPLTLVDVSGAFIILITGHLFASLVLAIEIFMKWTKPSIKTKITIN